MVASRRRELITQKSGVGYNRYDHVDLENGNAQNNTLRPRQRFRDAIETTIDQARGIEMKKKLLESVDREGLEQYRKSDEEVRLCNFDMRAMADSDCLSLVEANQEQKGAPLLRGAEWPLGRLARGRHGGHVAGRRCVG